MYLPHSLSGKASKETQEKQAQAVRIFGNTGIALEEFGITESANEIQAYVKVSPGDTLSLDFEIPCTELQIVDIFVDGVLRESNITPSRPINTHRGKVTKVCACEVRPSKAKGKLEYCDMVVEDRDATGDMNPSAPGFEDLHISAVGTIEVRVLREISPAAVSEKALIQEQADRGPTFEDHSRWWNVSTRVDPSIIAPTYQIGRYKNGRKTHGSSRKNVNRGIEGYYLWASFKFLYRAASDIQAAGFHTIDNLPNLPSKKKIGRPANLTNKMASFQSAIALPDNKSSLSSKPASRLSINQISSDLLQPPVTGPVAGIDDSEITRYAGISKEEFHVVTPIKVVHASNSMTAVSDADQKAREVKANQRSGSLQARCKTNYGGNETRNMEPSNKSMLEIANRKRAKCEPLTEEKMSREAPLPGSHWSEIINGKQPITTSAEEAVMKDTHTENNSILSQPKSVHGNTAIIKSPESRNGSSNSSNSLSGDARQERDRRMISLADVISSETDPKRPMAPSGSLHINSRECEEAMRGLSVPKNSSDVSHLPPSASLSVGGESGAADQEIGINQKLGVANIQWVPNTQRTAPHNMMRAKAGHYVARSPLVDPDTAELEGHAKALTNGKGDWRDRTTQMLRALSVSGSDRAWSDDSSSRSDLQLHAAQKLATGVLPNSASNNYKKRKFGEVETDSADILPLNSGRLLSVDNLDRLGMSPKERREELVRKKRAKQEALENARAEADVLRREVQEIEAGQAEAIAREEAELKELDIEIKTIKDETHALSARLRELNE